MGWDEDKQEIESDGDNLKCRWDWIPWTMTIPFGADPKRCDEIPFLLESLVGEKI